jgi:hypothetical protein
MIDKDTHTNKLQLLFRKPITKNSKVKRAWLGAMGDRPGSPSRVRMSEDKVRRKYMCWSVGIFLVRMNEDKVRRKDMCWSVGIFLGS